MKWNYMVTEASFKFDKEGHVLMCETIAQAKEDATKWAQSESDPHLLMWDLRTQEVIFEGWIPDPEFRFFEVEQEQKISSGWEVSPAALFGRKER